MGYPVRQKEEPPFPDLSENRGEHAYSTAWHNSLPFVGLRLIESAVEPASFLAFGVVLQVSLEVKALQKGINVYNAF